MNKRYDLCPPAGKYGCGFILLFVGLPCAVVLCINPKYLAGLLIFIPALPIAYWTISGWIQSFGQVLEVDEEMARLLKNGQEQWRFRWADIRKLRVFGNLTWEFVDSEGTVYPLIVINLAEPKQPELQGYLLDGVEIESKRIQVIRRAEGPSYPLAILFFLIAIAGLGWGGAGFVRVMRILRLGAEGEIDTKLLLWQMAALIAGVLAAVGAGSEFRRKPFKPQVWTKPDPNLNAYLRKNDPVPFPAGESRWTVAPGREKRRRGELGFIGVCLVFWGTISASVVMEFLRDHRTWPILAMYCFILSFHFFGIYLSAVKLDPKGVSIHIDGDEVWLARGNLTFRAQFAKFLGTPSVKVAMDGRNRFIDAEDFRLAPDSGDSGWGDSRRIFPTAP